MGLGTPMVESVTSYLTRLAAAHSLTVGALVRSSLPTFLRPTEQSHRTNIGELLATAERANGLSGRAEDWSVTIGALAGRDLRPLTLRGWAAALAAPGCLRRKISYCAVCLEEMAEAGTVYEPLAWSIVQVTDCPVHDSALPVACPHCGGQQRPLRLRGRPGICGSCGRWLGSRSRHEIPSGGQRSSRAVASLIPMVLSQAALLRSLDAAIKAAGTQRNLAQLADVTAGSLSMWRRGLLRPSLDPVLSLCGAGPWEVLAFLDGRLVPDADGAVVGRSKPRRRRTALDWPAIRRRLGELSERPQPPSLAQACIELGTDKGTLRENLPAETQALVQRHRQQVKRAAAERRAAVSQLVIDVTTSLLARGSKASRREVERALPGAYQLREQALGDAWRRARADFTGP